MSSCLYTAQGELNCSNNWFNKSNTYGELDCSNNDVVENFESKRWKSAYVKTT